MPLSIQITRKGIETARRKSPNQSLAQLICEVIRLRLKESGETKLTECITRHCPNTKCVSDITKKKLCIPEPALARQRVPAQHEVLRPQRRQHDRS